jgi:hypothetical protein
MVQKEKDILKTYLKSDEKKEMKFGNKGTEMSKC